MAAPINCMRCTLSRILLNSRSRHLSTVPNTWKGNLVSQGHIKHRQVTVSPAAFTAPYSSQSGTKDPDSSDNERKQKLNLAKPGRKSRPDSKQERSDMQSRMMKATKAVSEALGGDKAKTESDLLSALRGGVIPTQKSAMTKEKAEHTLKNLFSGMKVENTKSRVERPQRDRQRTEKDGTRTPRKVEDIKLYSGPALGIFTASALPSVETEEKKLSFFGELEQAEIQRRTKFPVANAFEEMIDWTKEGKLWKFPVDNEQGMDEEAQVGFHEHVFLEHLLEEGFPQKGPIRHFMELVVVGLSKNPYLSVQEKHAHVDWFRNYFKDKIEIVEALLKESQKTNAEQQNA